MVVVDGHHCELQLNCTSMLRAKETTGHRDFEVVRELQAAVDEGDLAKVESSFAFGLEHLGSGVSGGKAALGALLCSADARTLMHRAASRGHADIIHAFLEHGADPNAIDAKGNTPLHLAAFHGFERCVWCVLCSGFADLDIENHEGQTPLAMGFIALWQRPPEPAVRAVSTLAQFAGAARVKTVQAVADAQIKKRLKVSFALVDHASVGDVDKMRREVRRPNSSLASSLASSCLASDPRLLVRVFVCSAQGLR